MKEKKSSGEIWAFKVAAGRQILRLIERWGDISNVAVYNVCLHGYMALMFVYFCLGIWP